MNGDDNVATAVEGGLGAIERLESEVRSYSRVWPAVFTRARGHVLTDDDGTQYIDFFSAAGSLNYGHNHPDLKLALIELIAGDPVISSLDTATPDRVEFLETMESLIFAPRGLDYVVQFCGPTGTNAVEAAMKLARKVTGRFQVMSFTNAFHGLTLGALSTTANSLYRDSAGVPLTGVTVMPFDGYLGPDVDTHAYLETFLDDPASGVDLPAAVIVETIQAEGGINVASTDWLRGLAELCDRHGIMLIVDDIQAGCGRTGSFFSFEDAGIVPDIVCLSKSISGYGMPMALNLIKPEYDQWAPGEHMSTFQGFGPALVTATAALNLFWSDEVLSEHVTGMGRHLTKVLESIRSSHRTIVSAVRGRGMIQGIECVDPDDGARIATEAFERGLIVETAGSRGQVVKILPPLVIGQETLDDGVELLAEAIAAVAARGPADAGRAAPDKAMTAPAPPKLEARTPKGSNGRPPTPANGNGSGSAGSDAAKPSPTMTTKDGAPAGASARPSTAEAELSGALAADRGAAGKTATETD